LTDVSSFLVLSLLVQSSLSLWCCYRKRFKNNIKNYSIPLFLYVLIAREFRI